MMLVDPDLPPISEADVADWLANTEESGRAALGLNLAKLAAVQSGQMPPQSLGNDFEDRLNGLKRTVAIVLKMREMFTSKFGQAPHAPASDLDEQFFAIISDLYGRDITGGSK